MLFLFECLDLQPSVSNPIENAATAAYCDNVEHFTSCMDIPGQHGVENTTFQFIKMNWWLLMCSRHVNNTTKHSLLVYFITYCPGCYGFQDNFNNITGKDINNSQT